MKKCGSDLYNCMVLVLQHITNVSEKKMEKVNKNPTLVELQKRLIYQVRKLIFGLSIESPVEDLEKVRNEIKLLSEQLQRQNNEELGTV